MNISYYVKLYGLTVPVFFVIDLIWLAVVGVAFSIIGAFYYLRVIKLIYFDKPVDTSPLVPSGDTQIALSLNGLAMLLLGMFPAALLALCQGAFG